MGQVRQTVLGVAGREVVITNPDKVIFPQAGHTKLDLVKYYAAVAKAALRGIAARPLVLKRYVNGAEREPFFQKRAPEQRPEWVETVELRFPSGRTAREIVVRDAAQLLWMVNLGCIDLNPHPVRADDLEHPDELRVDLDPGPGVSWGFVRRVTLLVRDLLDEQGLRGLRNGATRRPASTARRDPSMHSSSCLHRKRLQASETRRGRRTIRSNVTSRRASRRHDGRPRAPAPNAAATVSLPSHSSPSPRRRVRRTRSRASNAGRPGIRQRRRGCTWTMSSSTRCAADRPTGLASGSICATFPRASARQKIRPNLTMISGPRRRAADYGRARQKRGPARRRV